MRSPAEISRQAEIASPRTPGAARNLCRYPVLRRIGTRGASVVETMMGFLVGLFGLIVGFVGFWLDFSADPFSGQSPSSYFDIGAIGIAFAIAGFIIQMWPRSSAHRPAVLAQKAE